MKLTLTRISEYNGATLGVLCFNGKPEMLTLELPDRGNAADISCIPEGTYKIQRYFSKTLNYVLFTVLGVQGRSGIHFHIGNMAKEIRGCVLVGQRYSYVADKVPSLLNSQKAFARFMEIMSGIDDAELTIISAYGKGAAH